MPEIPTNSLYAMAGVFGLLLISTAARLALARGHARVDHAELRRRIQSWWWMTALLFAALVLSRNTAIVFFGFLSFLALKEFMSIVPTRRVDRRLVFWAYVAIPVQYYWIATGWYGMFIVFIPVYAFLFLPLRAVLLGETEGFIRSVSTVHWALMLTVYCLSHMAYLLMLPERHAAAGAMGMVLFLVFMTQFNDVCQFLWGKTLGKRKIVPKVSPNKTWAGFLGGAATTTLCAGFAAPYLTPFSQTEGWWAGALIAVSGFGGDVVLSAVKRDLHIKDSGQLIPGHGGVLDRLDSLIYTAPLFFHFAHYLHG